MPVITKNKEGFGKQRFASFSQTKQIATPILNKYGLHVEQHMVSVNGMPAIETIVAHNSGQTIKSLFEVPGFLFNDLKAPRNDSGANISYFKRHTYESILGIIIVD
jgi:hypothetical protein